MDGRLFFFITSSWMHRQQKSSMQKKFMVEKSWKLSSVRAERKTTTRYFQIFDIFLDNDIPYISWTRTSFRQSELSFREYLKIGCNKKVVGHLKKHFIFQCIFNLTYKLQHFFVKFKIGTTPNSPRDFSHADATVTPFLLFLLTLQNK